MSEVRVIRAEDRRPGDATAGMSREEAAAREGYWSGYVTTDPGAASGWHHHGEYETSIYVSAGALRMEFGPGGSRSFDAGPGDFIHVPGGAVHRESNPSGEESLLVVTRVGQGPVVVEADGLEG